MSFNLSLITNEADSSETESNYCEECYIETQVVYKFKSDYCFTRDHIDVFLCKKCSLKFIEEERSFIVEN